jgi:hypothetical protein
MKIKSLKRLKRRIQRKCGYFYHWGRYRKERAAADELEAYLRGRRGGEENVMQREEREEEEKGG